MEQTRLWNKNYILIMVTNLFTSFSFYIVATLLVAYLTSDKIGFTSAAAGVIAGMFSITALFCRPFCGIMSDRLNKVWLIRCSVLMMTLGLVGYTLSGNMTVIVIARIIHGIGFAINGTASIAMAANFIPKDKMAEGVGYFGLANVAASAVGPGIGVMVSESLGTLSVFYVCAVTCLLALVSTFFIDNMKVEKKPSRGISLEDIITPKAIGYALVSAAFSFSNGVISTYLLLYSKALGVASISLYFTIYAIVLFVVRPFSGKLMDKKGLAFTAVPGIIIAALSMFLLSATGSMSTGVLIMILISGVLRAIGQGAAQPSLQTACLQIAGPEKRGASTSTFYLGADIAQGVAPMIAGLIIVDNRVVKSYQISYGLCGVLMCIALCGLFVILAAAKKNSSK